jgi:hypothetical protein
MGRRFVLKNRFNVLLTVLELLFISLIVIGLSGMREAKAASYVAPTSMFDDQEEAWANLELRMLHDKDSTIVVSINGEGGYNDIAFQFVKVVKMLQFEGKRVEFVVTTEAVSNHARVVCFGDSVKLVGHAKLIFHDSFDIDQSKIQGHKVYDNPASTSGLFQQCVTKGLLTQSDVFTITVLHKRIEEYANLQKVVLDDWKEW